MCGECNKLMSGAELARRISDRELTSFLLDQMIVGAWPSYQKSDTKDSGERTKFMLRELI